MGVDRTIHWAKRIGSYLRLAWFAAPSQMRQVLRSIIEFLLRMVFGWHVVVIGGIEGTIAMIERLVPAFNLSISTWWKLLWVGLSAAALWTFHKVRKERDNARNNFRRKSATLMLARELGEMIPKSPWGDIHTLSKKVHVTRDPTTIEQVEDVKRRWLDFVKIIRDKLIGTNYEDEFGYEDDSDEWVRIRDLDTSDIPGTLDILKRECQLFSIRLDNVTTNMRQSAAAITANTLPN